MISFYLDLDVPTITSSHTSNIFENGSVALTCSATGYPAPTYNWLKNNRVVGSSATLMFSSVTRQDGGTYMCESENAAKKDYTPFYLAVHCKFVSHFS